MCWKEKCWQCAAAAASDCGSSLVAALLVHAEEESVGELRLARPPQARYKFSDERLGNVSIRVSAREAVLAFA